MILSNFNVHDYTYIVSMNVHMILICNQALINITIQIYEMAGFFQRNQSQTFVAFRLYKLT